MATKRTQTAALLAVVVGLGAVLWYELRPAPAGTPAPPSNEVAARSGGTTAQAAPGGVVDVNIEGLAAPRPEPSETDRNPFLFKPKPPPPPAGPSRQPGPPPGPVTPPPPAGPPPPPPITVKFIGIVDAPTQAGRLAVLSDKGNVFMGREGESGIDGRFKIWKIGVESIDISYVDGRGRTTIRLSGS